MIERAGARVLVDPVSLDLLAGAELDFTDELMGSHFCRAQPERQVGLRLRDKLFRGLGRGVWVNLRLTFFRASVHIATIGAFRPGQVGPIRRRQSLPALPNGKVLRSAVCGPPTQEPE